MTEGPSRSGLWPLGLARIVSVAEATSFLLLLVASAVKNGADEPIGVTVLGPLHGALVIAYVLLTLYVGAVYRWRLVRIVLALVAAVLPVAPYFVERRWLREQPAAGAPSGPAAGAPVPAQD